ncbi:MAG: hypothetical protein MUE44_09535 [Oscillatoriaceae cyanobacterium Prado104]|nr:hypothetical protein [Oscillatoriaceae cyanobacterium Prado104]
MLQKSARLHVRVAIAASNSGRVVVLGEEKVKGDRGALQIIANNLQLLAKSVRAVPSRVRSSGYLGCG